MSNPTSPKARGVLYLLGITIGGLSDAAKSLLREILAKLDDISARQAALEEGLLNLEGTD